MKKTSDEYDLYDIDLHKLHEEWVEHPRRIIMASLELADRRADHSQAEGRRDVTEAELDRKIRLDLEANGQKVTEKVVEHAVTRHKDMQRAEMEVIEAKHAMDVAYAHVAAVSAKTTALESLVRLSLASYYKSGPRLDEEERDRQMEKVFNKKARRDS